MIMMESVLKQSTEMNAEIFTKPNAKSSILRDINAIPPFHVRRSKALVIKENVP